MEGLYDTNIEQIILSETNIKEIPSNINKFHNLKHFCSEECKIRKLSGDFCDELIYLEHMGLDNNRISEFPNNFGKNLINLTLLSLRHNKLDKIPNGFSNLINLLEIDLSYNNIKIIPGSKKEQIY